MSAASSEEVVERFRIETAEQSLIVARCEAQLHRALHDGECAAKRMGHASERMMVLRKRHTEAVVRLRVIDEHVAAMALARSASGPQRAELAALGPVGRLPETPHLMVSVEDGGEFVVIGSPAAAQACSARAITVVAGVPVIPNLEAGMRRHFALEYVRGGWYRTSERLAAFVLEVRHGHDVGWMMDRIVGGQA